MAGFQYAVTVVVGLWEAPLLKGWLVDGTLDVGVGIWIVSGLLFLILVTIVWSVRRRLRLRLKRATKTRFVARETEHGEESSSSTTSSPFTPCDIVTQAPKQLSEPEFSDFVTLALTGGEVFRRGLERRVRKAEKLVLLRVAGHLAGIGALKKPEARYRQRLAAKSGVVLLESQYPIELGWIVVSPNYRGRGYSNMITAAALAVADEVGIFATARDDNLAMHRTLKNHGFVRAGRPYLSAIGDRQVCLFVRAWSDQGARADPRNERSGVGHEDADSG